jgi:hypothetical protein
MRVLVACEFSGRVREAFRARGHDARSCDLLPADDHSYWHYQEDVRVLLDGGWDLMIAFPPCTHLAVSGAKWFKDKVEEQKEALDFVAELLSAPIPRIALENPVGIISTKIRKPDQIIQPYQFGEDASKKTCLWLVNLPPLRPSRYVEPRIVGGRKLWANQTPSGQNKLGPSPDRARIRSITYQGIADAMADQWGGLDA